MCTNSCTQMGRGRLPLVLNERDRQEELGVPRGDGCPWAEGMRRTEWGCDFFALFSFLFFPGPVVPHPPTLHPRKLPT